MRSAPAKSTEPPASGSAIFLFTSLVVCYPLPAGARKLAIFSTLFQKKWFIAFLLTLLIIETAILITIIFQTYSSRQIFPGLSPFHVFQPQCSTLTAETTSQGAENRTVVFTCQGRAALAIKVGFQLIPERSAPVAVVIPTFSFPPGYLKLYLANYGSGCSSEYATLESGEAMAVGGTWGGYNYCAVIDSGMEGRINGFTIVWSPGEPPRYRPAPFDLSASPSEVTISAGQTARATITATSRDGWSGNLTFHGQGLTIESKSGGPTTWSFSPSSILVKADGSNSTIMSVMTNPCSLGEACTGTGRWIVGAYAYIVPSGCLKSLQGHCVDLYAAGSVGVTLNVIQG